MVAISPGQAYVSKADRIDLRDQMNLQLGTKGSRTRINHGARAKLRVGPVNEACYFDVVDIDRYDVILGTPFLKKHNVVLNFKTRTVIIDGVNVGVYSAVEDAEVLKTRAESRKQRIVARLRETAERVVGKR